MGESVPQRPYNLKQFKAREGLELDTTSCATIWYRLGGVLCMKHLQCQRCQDDNFDITWHTHRAGLPGVVSSLPRAEKGRLFACFLSQDGCPRPDLVEASWLRGRWCHSALPAAAGAWGVAPTSWPQREAVVESQLCVGFMTECQSVWGRRKKAVFNVASRLTVMAWST